MRLDFERPTLKSTHEKETTQERKRKAALAVAAGVGMLLNIIKPAPTSAALTLNNNSEMDADDIASIEAQLTENPVRESQTAKESTQSESGILNEIPQVAAMGWVDEYLDKGYEITSIQTIGEILLVNLSDGRETQIIACNLKDHNINDSSSASTQNQDKERRLNAVNKFMEKSEIQGLDETVRENLKKTLELGLIPDFERLNYKYDKDGYDITFYRNNNDDNESILILGNKVRFTKENDDTYFTFQYEDDNIIVTKITEKDKIRIPNTNFYKVSKEKKSEKLDRAELESMESDVFNIF